jgi:hypothetical protein
VVTSLGAKLNRAYKMEEEAESRLEQFKEEAHKQKEKVREWNTEVGKLKCHVKRFNVNSCHALAFLGLVGSFPMQLRKLLRPRMLHQMLLK